MRDNPSPLMMHSPQISQYALVHQSPPQAKKVSTISIFLLWHRFFPVSMWIYMMWCIACGCRDVCLVWCNWSFGLLQEPQRGPSALGGIKEEKLPPSPVMRGEPFSPAMRQESHKHPESKPTMQGHSQQSEWNHWVSKHAIVWIHFKHFVLLCGYSKLHHSCLSYITFIL